MQILCRLHSLWHETPKDTRRRFVNTDSPPFGLVMIVERLIKIHRRPIYLHYSLLQMWSFKLQNFSQHKSFFISTPAYHRWRRPREKQFKNIPEPWKIIQFSSCIRIKRLQKANCTPKHADDDKITRNWVKLWILWPVFPAMALKAKNSASFYSAQQFSPLFIK